MQTLLFRLFIVLQNLLHLEFFDQTAVAIDIKFDLFNNDVFLLNQTEPFENLALGWVRFLSFFIDANLLSVQK